MAGFFNARLLVEFFPVILLLSKAPLYVSVAVNPPLNQVKPCPDQAETERMGVLAFVVTFWQKSEGSTLFHAITGLSPFVAETLFVLLVSHPLEEDGDYFDLVPDKGVNKAPSTRQVVLPEIVYSVSANVILRP